MERLFAVLVMLFATLALGQHNQFNPIVDSPVDFAQVSDGDAYVTGNWVALDEHSKLPGVSVSEIRCDRAEVCHELQANLIFVGGDEFDLTPDALDYNIVRWNSKEIVAQNIGGICKVLNSLRVDRLTKKVYYLQSLSEPVESLPEMSKKMCNAVGLRLELHAKSVYSTRPTSIKVSQHLKSRFPASEDTTLAEMRAADPTLAGYSQNTLWRGMKKAGYIRVGAGRGRHSKWRR